MTNEQAVGEVMAQVAALSPENAAIIKDPEAWLNAKFDALRERAEKAEAEAEQLRVQLAGCGAAALGYGDGCKPGDYGYSASFGDVQRMYDELERTRDAAAFLIAYGKGPLYSSTQAQRAWGYAVHHFLDGERAERFEAHAQAAAAG